MKTILNALSDTLLHIGRARTREVLLRQSDRMLDDAGFSRELLLQGVHAWPWRTDAALADEARDAASMRERRRQAVRELRALDDRELADLDIGRADIVRAVNEGRPGIDAPVGRDERLAA